MTIPRRDAVAVGITCHIGSGKEANPRKTRFVCLRMKVYGQESEIGISLISIGETRQKLRIKCYEQARYSAQQVVGYIRHSMRRASCVNKTTSSKRRMKWVQFIQMDKAAIPCQMQDTSQTGWRTGRALQVSIGRARGRPAGLSRTKIHGWRVRLARCRQRLAAPIEGATGGC